MDRRGFLQGIGALGSLALLPQAFAATDIWQQSFQQSLRRNDWLKGWQGIEVEALPERRLAWTGRPPAALRGTLYRNGPGLFERAGTRYRHWFDGDGLVQKWSISDTGVSHQAQLIETPKLAAERAAGRFLRQAAGTFIEDAEPSRNNDDGNTANTSMLAHGGQLYALWEGGSAWQIDPDTLAARGRKSWRDDLANLPFSAHPLRDADGSLWNFGLAAYAEQPLLLVWHLAADGNVLAMQTVELQSRGYLHSFSITDGHLVFVLAPWLYEPDASGAFFDRMRWSGGQGSEVIVLAKDALDVPRRYEMPTGLAFHFGSAYEDGESIMLHACWNAEGGKVIDSLANVMRGQPMLDADHPLLRIELSKHRGGSAKLTEVGPRRVEFPSWDSRFAGAGGRQYFGAQLQPEAPYLDSVLAWDPRSERVDSFSYGRDWLVEEHLFVPRSIDARRDGGWLIGTALDVRTDRLRLSVFDATHLADGPLCHTDLPRSMPLGFHGCFVPAVA